MKKLLMVDDVATNLRLVAEVLKGQYEVCSARSGEQALVLVDKEMPDLILLDISMPKMDGYGVMDKLREKPETARIPVIVLTGDTTRETEAKALKLGAVDFIRKPFEPQALKTRIERALAVAELKTDLEVTARKDPLTGLWNRSYIEEYLDKVEEEYGSVLMLDLDNFKKLNDTYGHVIGDKALVAFARALESEIPEGAIVSRLGGDEFVIILPNCIQRDTIRTMCRELIAKVELQIGQVLGDSPDFATTVSVGISQYPGDGKDFLTLYTCSDKALYYVKQNGKRGYHFYQDDCRTLAEITRENTLIDMEQLKLIITENSTEKGAYQVEYQGFTKIYRFVTRCVERTGQNVQIVLFTLGLKDESDDMQYLSNAMSELESSIAGVLRRADVATRFSATQFGTILMDTTKDNGIIAVNRVLDSFEKLGFNEHVSINYEIQDVTRE